MVNGQLPPGFKRKTMRPKSELKFVAELSLIHSIPDMTQKKNTGRLGSLFDQLQKITQKDLFTKFGDAIEEEYKWLHKVITQFGNDSGWETNEKHISTVLSFCCRLAERDEKFNPRILEKLNLIIEYLEKGGHLKMPNCWAGSVALDKWDAIFKQEQQGEH